MYFYPPYWRGLVIHIIGILASLAIGILGVWQLTRAQIGPALLLYLIPVFFALVFVPLFGYRAYALLRAFYLIERDGILLRWGLREVVIPMDLVNTVRPFEDMDARLPLPWIRWPGAVLGARDLLNGDQIEYLAAGSRQLILIFTSERIYAVSPAKPEEFMSAYLRFAELGSLTPLAARSVYPASLLRSVWASLPARYLLLGGVIVSLLLLVFVSLSVPSRPEISLGFLPDGSPSEMVPSARLLLLPILNTFFYLAIVLIGLYFFRMDERRTMAYLLWGCGLFAALLFIGAVGFILSAG